MTKLLAIATLAISALVTIIGIIVAVTAIVMLVCGASTGDPGFGYQLRLWGAGWLLSLAGLCLWPFVGEHLEKTKGERLARCVLAANAGYLGLFIFGPFVFGVLRELAHDVLQWLGHG